MTRRKTRQRYLKPWIANLILVLLVIISMLCIKITLENHDKDKEISSLLYQLDKEKTVLNNIIFEQKDYIDELENAEPKDFVLDDLTIEEKFKAASQIYDTDYALVYAIARHETGNFTSDLAVNHNNFGGMRSSSGDWMTFSNDFEGILEMVRNIKKYYIDKGLDTVEEIAPVYCPPTADSWTQAIYTMMAEVKGE